MVGDVLAMVDEYGNFLFQTIPSTLRRQKPGRQWSFSSGTLTEDFGVDLSQNLIIFLTGVEGTNATESSVKVHIRSLEDGTLHPTARGDAHLDMPYVEGAAYAILIRGSLAIAMYMIANPTLHTTFRIFNWKSGAPIPLSPKDGIEIQDLAFINERYLLLGVKEENLEDSNSPTLYLLVWDLQEDCSICKLNITLDEPCRHPQVTITPDYPIYASPSDTFSPSPDTQSFSVIYSEHTILLCASTLQNLIQKASTLSDSICLEVEWTSWGSETIAFCDETDIDSLHCHAFGKKLATLDIVDSTLRLFDFNRRAVLRRQYVDHDDDDDDVCVVHGGPSDFPVLIKAVSPSHLPFSQIQKKLQTKADISDAAGLVINSEAILVALVSPFFQIVFASKLLTYR
ncbi:hypothetical protein ONZ45_g5471 [Pleurotus djamor]|nr:hypothetical protein ONZ45_g5471 [Pleurotus djamor]